jgi:hypothetical protein
MSLVAAPAGFEGSPWRISVRWRDEGKSLRPEQPSWPGQWQDRVTVAHVTFSHVMVRVLIVPVSGSTDGVVDR